MSCGVVWCGVVWCGAGQAEVGVVRSVVRRMGGGSLWRLVPQ